MGFRVRRTIGPIWVSVQALFGMWGHPRQGRCVKCHVTCRVIVKDGKAPTFRTIGKELPSHACITDVSFVYDHGLRPL